MPSIATALSIILGCQGGTGDSGESSTDTSTEPESWDPRFDDFMVALQADLDESPAYGVSVAIRQAGQPDFAWALGYRDGEGTEPLTRDTLLMIGSTTKMFTATALLQAVEGGVLALDDSLGDLLPDLEFALDASWEDAVLAEHLITHRGAFVDAVDWAGPADDDELSDFLLGEFPDNYWLMAPPGEFFNYSNPGFSYAGLVTEVLDSEGRAWPEVMRDRVFEPLGMDRTYVRAADAEADGDWAESHGYIDVLTAAVGTVDMSNVTDPASQRPAGSSTWSTPSQMLQMAGFLLDGDPDVLGDDLRTAITTAQVETDYEGLYADGAYGREYGYGVSLSPGLVTGDERWLETRAWCHGGATLSFASRFCVLPDHGFAISILASGYGANFDASLAAAVETLVDGLSEPGDYEGPIVEGDRLDDHVGAYEDPYNVGEMIIDRTDDALTIEMPLLDLYRVPYQADLVPYSSDIHLLWVDGYWYELTFIGEADTPSSWVRNRSFVGSRVAGNVRDDGTQAEEKLRLGARPLPGALGDPARRPSTPKLRVFPAI